MERLLTSHVSISNSSREEFNNKFNAKIDFPLRYFTLPLLMLSQKSLHTLFDKHLDHILVKSEQNRMVRTIQNFELFCKKWLTIFDKVSMPFGKTLL